MKKDLTELVFIVDRSGSMSGLESDTIGGFNGNLKAHKEAEGDAVVSTVLFDHETNVLHDRVPIADVPEMTNKEYWVRGNTALLDALGGSIRHIERVHSYLPEDYRPEKTIFVVITDGYENASRKYSYSQIKDMIERKKREGWEFLFLGSNIDAIAEAGKMGIAADRAVTYLGDSIGQRKAYESVAEATCAMRSAPRMASVGGGWKAKVEADFSARGGAGGAGGKGTGTGRGCGGMRGLFRR